MFEELGLNVARQADNGANPRPDNRSGWLDGETPDVVEARARHARAAERRRARGAAVGSRRRSCASRASAMSRRAPTALPTRPRRCGADTGGTRRDRDPGATGRAQGARAVPAHAARQRAAGPERRARRPAGAAAVLEQLPRPRRPSARAGGGRRRRAALGRRRGRVAAGVGHDDRPQAPRAEARRVQGHASPRCCSARATSRTSASSARSRGPARSSSPTSSTTPRSSTAAGCRGRRSSSTTTTTSSTSPGGCAQAGPRAALIVTESVFSMDGDVAPLEEIAELARALRRARRRRRGARDRLRRRRRARRGRRGGPRGRDRRRRRDARQGARAPTARSPPATPRSRSYLTNCARSLIFSTAPPPPAVAGALAALELLCEQPRRVERLQANAEVLRAELAREGFDVVGLDDADRAADRRRRVDGDARLRGGARARRVRAGDPAADRARRARRGCDWP